VNINKYTRKYSQNNTQGILKQSITRFNLASHILNDMGEACSACGESRGVYRVLVEKLRERDHLGDPGVDGRIILRWIFR